MAYDLTGKVKVIQDAQVFGSGFEKRELVVTDDSNPKYPQDINLEFVQDKVNLLDNLQIGQEVTVTFDVRGREYNGRYFVNLQAWKIAGVSAAQTPPPVDNPHVSDEDDDIAF